MSTILIGVFVGALLLGVPIAFVMGIASLAVLLIDGSFPLVVVPQRMFNGLDSFPLMAVPFFILAADLMTAGRITQALLSFSRALVGHIRGGMGHVNVLVSVFFAGISGSALADAAGPSAIAMRMMNKAGYPMSYSAALSAATATIGPIIPPSIIMVIYGISESRVSIAQMFLAGILPGCLMGLALALANLVISRRNNYGGGQAFAGFRTIAKTALKAIPAILVPLIILGGILGGVFTPTEAAAVAVVYSLLVGFAQRTLTIGILPQILLRSALLSSAVLMIVSTASIFAWLLTVSQLPQDFGAAIAALKFGELGTLLLLALLILVFGLFIDTIPAVIVLTPILAPIAFNAGVDPLHFAMVLILNLTVGMVTPPVGPVLFVISTVGRIRIEVLTRAILPLLAVQLFVLLLIILFPQITLAIPRLFGYGG
ncbi:TRAP transporter large permease [Amorphus orientalis]|uniref:TRAP transporter large permease protein n=1 Tax=Amorphus orientalis TaxID=649198 RepID=A0AAE3VM83_9HYPH|nr:TRAP transporter large permease [Amorphus orientalis]MDQ0314523.1 tripartite ATP-independent transporter DctM subunit [Amorphus orientalis]